MTGKPLWVIDISQYSKRYTLLCAMTLSALSSYVDMSLGNPIAQEIIDDKLREAFDALHDDENKHSVLLASLLVRIALEQSLKTLVRC